MLIIVVGMTACCSFVRTVPKVKEHELPEACDGLIPMIKKKWKKNREQEYYQYDKGFLDTLQNKYADCLLKLPAEKVIKLFGKPLEGHSDSFLIYYVKPGCIGFPQDCERLVFRIKDNVVKEFYVGKYEFIEQKE